MKKHFSPSVWDELLFSARQYAIRVMRDPEASSQEKIYSAWQYALALETHIASNHREGVINKTLGLPQWHKHRDQVETPFIPPSFLD
jgi:hypothetical protein